MRLSDLQNKESAIITKVRGRGAFRKRIMEMGFVKGQKVTVIKNAPLKDPIEYSIMGYDVSLRRSEASLIEVITKEEAKKEKPAKFNGTITDNELKQTAREKQKTINVALVGNPNCGKTTLFNFASKSKERVGNYGGVTIDSKKAKYDQNGYRFNITDLPGTYSLSAYTPEELFVRKHILGEMPDIVINVVDASNLERNLYITTQLIDMDIKVIIALNMYDELEKKGDYFDYQSLGKMMGIPVIPTISHRGKGIKELFDKAIEVFEDKDPTVRHIHINYGEDVEKAIQKIQDEIWKNKRLTDLVSSRFYAIKLLEKDKAAEWTLSNWENYEIIKSVANREIVKLENAYSEDSEAILTDSKYAFIAGALKETYKRNTKPKKQSRTGKIDNILTNKYLGFPIFFAFMYIMFQATFQFGQYPMEWIEQLVGVTGDFIDAEMPSGVLKDLIVDGIIDGVGGVIVFLPNILILFLFITLMEDTGYMARAAFIMDKVMHKIGLHGQSFIPLLMGFGCNVPAIMATRTIKNKNNRLVTILINPFMSCSARLPVYVLIISAFFPKHPGTILFFIYLFGIMMAALVAILFKKTIFKSDEIPFVMELPPYRMPTSKNILRHVWSKGSQYLKKMGGVILVASIIVWALGYYPQDKEIINRYDQKIEELARSAEQTTAEKKRTENNTYEQKISEIESKKDAALQENSYIGRIGHGIEPIMRPLGFDWKMSVSLLSGVAAKEIVVSTMGVLYQVDAKSSTDEKLVEKLQNARHESGPRKGDKVFDRVTAISYLLFVLLYFPCIAAVVAIKKETGSWKWAVFGIVYTTILAWVISFLAQQIGQLFV
ncbi:MAG: ferrous iron transport protein B [Bacteroidales bacterium]